MPATISPQNKVETRPQKPKQERVEIRPQPGPQETFLSSSADIVIYGGGAGGGKTWSLLLECLRHISVKGFGAVIFRRTSPQITNEGGLWDESQKLYPLLGARPNSSNHEWVFPKKTVVSMSHLQHEKNIYDWQGSQIPLICFDELTHFTLTQFFYMLSRNRSMCGVKPYVRATCNPDPDSWVAKFIEWWIDQDERLPDGSNNPRYGLPISERAGKLRWFIRVNGEIVWADTKEELLPRLPKDLPPEVSPEDLIKSVTFIPSSVYDNKKLLEINPEYLGNLLSLPLVDRMRLLGGNWKVRATAGKFFNRAWFKLIEHLPDGGLLVRFWDFAATEKQLAKPDPDYSASILLRVVKDAERTRYIIEDAFQVQAAPADVEKLFLQTMELDKARARRTGARYQLRWEIEPGSAAIRESHRLVNLCAGVDARGVTSREDKLTRAKPLAVQAEHGNVEVLIAQWTDMLLAHLHGQPDLPHDDLMDACSGAFNAAVGKRSMQVN